MTRSLRMAAASAACTIITPAFAHHPAGVGNTGGSGPINTISATTLRAGQGAASAMLEYTRLRELSDAALGDSARANAPPVAHHDDDEDDHHDDDGGGDSHHGGADGAGAHSLRSVESTNIALAYGITDDLTVSARLPFVRRTDIREGLHFHDHPTLGEHVNVIEELGTASGVGDVTLFGQYRFLKDADSGVEMAALFGVKLPTGRTDEKIDVEERFEAEFQPGSGSWDGQFGLAATLRQGPWSFDASALYNFVTEGTQDTDLGDRLNYGVAISYRLNGFSAAAPGPSYAGAHHDHSKHDHQQNAESAAGLVVDLVLELNGEWSNKQDIAGESDINSGGHTLYVVPGVRLSHSGWSGFSSIGIPIVDDLNGLQAEPDWRLTSGLSFAF